MNETKSTDNNYHKRIGNTNITSFTIYKLMNIFASSYIHVLLLFCFYNSVYISIHRVTHRFITLLMLFTCKLSYINIGVSI